MVMMERGVVLRFDKPKLIVVALTGVVKAVVFGIRWDDVSEIGFHR